jgi:GDP-mannose 6-dehydrogenase
MKINVYGLGYVGCINATCFAIEGHDVTGIDLDSHKVKIINKGNSPIIEKGLSELIKKAVHKKKLRATVNNIGTADVSVICVGTPSNENGSQKMDYIKRVCEQVGENIRNNESYHVVNVRSTVLPGTIDDVVIPSLTKFSGKDMGKDFGVCMNPEFMREGTSLYDYYNPPFTIIGQSDKKSGILISRLYKTIEAPIYFTDIKIAEMIKYACNSFHALKIAFANEIGNICKKMNIDSHEVMKVFCADNKLNISPYYLKPGFAFGGSCLPKDLRSLLYTGKELDLELPVLNSILRSNLIQVEIAFQMIKKLEHKKVGILGLSFKPGTDDLRESPIVELVEKLIGKGYKVSIYDKEVELSKIFGSNKYYIERVIPHISSLMKKTIKEVIDGSHVIVVGKKTKEFSDSLKKMKDNKFIIDLDRSINKTSDVKGSYNGICW